MVAAIAAAGIAAAGALGGGAMGASGAKSGAKAQADASRYAADVQAKTAAQTRSDLLPYNLAGQQNLPAYTNFWQGTQSGVNALLAQQQSLLPGQMTQAQLEQTPGYQFQLSQAQKALNASASARGLGVSGAALKGAMDYATGLANSNFQTQFGNEQTRFGDVGNLLSNYIAGQGAVFGQLKDPVSIGENAAATSGNLATTSAANQGQAISNAGAAIGAGDVLASKDLGNAVSSASGAGYNYLAMQNMLNPPGSTVNNPNNPSAINIGQIT